ncbi:hypothetical protein PIB30_083268 [Stylosanthes scabra]|uniref:Uncharacterized protein n=1 Tax=Stylosanthes scabra TaxID=79078 RepID=A0ABU6RS77_9FABA|nr:hypothetical protein [Stylosanthes scabra]
MNPNCFQRRQPQFTNIISSPTSMERRDQSSESKSRTLGDFSVGGDSRTCTLSGNSVGQPRKKKFSSPRCFCGSYAIIFQSCTKLNPDRFFLDCPNYNEWHFYVKKVEAA